MREAFAFSRFPGELPWAGIAQMRNALEGSGDLSAPGQQGWLIGRSLRKMIRKLKVSSLRTVPPPCPNRLTHPKRSLDGWSSGMRRALCGGCGSFQSWKFPVDWKLYKVSTLKSRSAQELSSLWDLCQREETRGKGQMQSCLEASPFQLRDRPPPAHPGFCLSQDLQGALVPTASLCPALAGHQAATWGWSH